jgi:hypothetical protein
MAAYEIISRQDPYFIVRVLFADLVFDQLLVSMKTGAALNASLKSYADAYEADYFLLQDIININ